MSFKWSIKTLNEVCLKITDGAHNSPKSVSIGKPMASVKDLTRFGVDLSEARLIANEDFDALVKQGCKPEIGDVLIAKDGNSALDTVCTVEKSIDAVMLSSVAILRPDPAQLNSDFLKYYLSSSDVINYLKSNFISGAAIPRVVLRDFKKAEILLPPLEVQREIASTLNSLEHRIGLLRETNATLESIAQALFKSWFVDFDPVRAKQEGREPEGMDAATAVLFPDSFDESELGLVPKGWRAGELGGVAEIFRKQIQPADLLSDTNYVGLEHVPRQSLGLDNWGSTDGLESAKNYFEQGDILFGKLRPNFHKVVLAPFSGVCSTDILVCRASAKHYHFFVALHLFSRDLVAYAERLSNGAKMPRVTWKDLAAFMIVIPDSHSASVFGEIVKPLLDQIIANVQKAKTLADLRDKLLPRLISGQLRLPECQELLKEAA